MSQLEAQIMEQLKEAMKSKNEAKLRSLRAIKAAILVEKTSGTGTEITEEKEIQLLNKLAKQRRDSLEIYTNQNRSDLAVKEQEELDVIISFLPAQFTEEEITIEVKIIIKECGASSMADMGKVMGLASKSMAGKADGKVISDIVKKCLS